MFSFRLISQASRIPRSFTQLRVGKKLFSRQSVVLKESADAGLPGGTAHSDLRLMKNPSSMERRILVSSKMYPTLEEVPDRVSQATLKKAKDWYRIRVCMWMIGATVAASVVMIIIGKRDAAAGETISKRGMEWQTRMRQQGLKEEAERDAAAAAAKN